MSNFLKKIFSIHNNINTCRTEYTVLGIKFKIYNQKLVKRPNYSFVISKLQEKFNNKEKIRVAFLVSENSKWNAEELYNLLDKSSEFEPFILVTLLSYVHCGDDVTRNNLEENYNFFLNSGKKVYKAYDNEKKEYISLKEFSPDIVFYQQPWGVSQEQDIEETSKFALTCHFHYGLNVFKSKMEDMPFYRKLFKYFVSHKEEEDILKSLEYVNTDVIGFPKLDIYKSIQRKSQQEKKTIIYAPHFSYPKDSILKIGTFDKTGEKILEFAKAHPEYNWIFKPHPVLKNELMHDKKYGEKFIEKYYGEWAKISNVYEQGNYFQMFMDSDLLITDCAAFLLEYIPTGKPIFRLEREDSVPLTEFGNKIVENIYRIYNFVEFERYFSEVLLNSVDGLKTKREHFIELNIGRESSSQRIIKKLIEIVS